jgi:uncharacterized protein (DUF433 family)
VLTVAAIHPAKPLTAESLQGDLIQPGHRFFGMIWINRERLSGAPCFAGTRVPIGNLFDYLESGYTLNQFLEDFDGVTPEQAKGVIEAAQGGLLAELPKL